MNLQLVICCKNIYLIVKYRRSKGGSNMQDEKAIREEIEELRKKLNEKVVNSDKRMPDPETMELSKRMDELLNMLNEVQKKLKTYKVSKKR